MAKPNRPTWFKLHEEFGIIANAVSSTDLGEGLKLAMKYFQTLEEPTEPMNPYTQVVFNYLRNSIDTAYADYENMSARGRHAANTRYQNYLKLLDK